MAQNEAFSRVFIDAQLADQGWNTQDTNSVRYEVALEDGTRADYVICDRHGRSLAVIEAKRFSVNPADAAEQARNYARQLNVPYIFLANGQEIRFWEWQREAYTQEEINIKIGNKPPRAYFADIQAQCSGGPMKYGAIADADTLKANLAANCVLNAMVDMDVEQFDDFLSQRRQLMAEKIRSYYEGL